MTSPIRITNPFAQPFRVDAAAAERAGLPHGEYLIRVTEVGVTLAYREYHTDTWLPPAIADVAP